MTVLRKVFYPINRCVSKGYQNVSEGIKHSGSVSQRAAQMQNKSKAGVRMAKAKGQFFGFFTPMIDALKAMSPSFNIAMGTLSNISRNTRIIKNRKPQQTWIRTKIQGFKESSPKIKDASKELFGINDIIAATEAGGKIQGAKEAGKAAARVSTTLAGFIGGNLIPIPGLSLAGWVGCEKLTELIFGKPYTKKLAQKIAKEGQNIVSK